MVQVGRLISIAHGVPSIGHPPRLVRLHQLRLVEDPDWNHLLVPLAPLIPALKLDVDGESVADRKNVAEPVADERRLFATLFPLGWDLELKLPLDLSARFTAFLFYAEKLGFKSLEFPSGWIPGSHLSEHLKLEGLHWQLVLDVVTVQRYL